MSNDWLDPTPQLPALVTNESQFATMIDALKRCSPKQRHYLNALQEHCYDDEAARKALSTKGLRVTRHAVQRWESESAFMDAIASAIEYTLAAAAVSHVGVLAQLQRAVRINGQTVKARTEDGVEYEKFVDASALNAALDRLAKRVRMFGDQDKGAVKDGPGLVIQINAPDRPAIDVTPSDNRVAITLPAAR